MKKFLSLILCAALAVTMLVMSGCSGSNNNTTANNTNTPNTAAALKFGAGHFVSTPAATDASEDAEGTGKVEITVAAVTVDADGKIVACDVDTMSNEVKYTADGKAVANDEFKTKYEAGADYNMVAHGGANREWFEQADAFEAVVAGKTLDEVKALMTEDGKGTDEVIKAGCTIYVNGFVGAVEDAYNSAVESNVTANDTLKVTAVTEQTCSDATEDKAGTNKVATTVFAAALGADGKVVAASSDCIEVTFTFDTKGVSTFDAASPVVSKKDAGADYGMVAYGGAAKEWFEQAAAFDAACIGKSAAEITSLMGEDGKGVEELQSAGCTILVSGFVKAASKIG